VILPVVDFLTLLFGVASIILCFAWSHADQKARDYGTDLQRLITQKDLDSRDLRRSLRHKQIRQKVYSNYDMGDSK